MVLLRTGLLKVIADCDWDCDCSLLRGKESWLLLLLKFWWALPNHCRCRRTALPGRFQGHCGRSRARRGVDCGEGDGGCLRIFGAGAGGTAVAVAENGRYCCCCHCCCCCPASVVTTFGGARGLQFFLLEYTVFQLKISGVVPDDVQTVCKVR